MPKKHFALFTLVFLLLTHNSFPFNAYLYLLGEYKILDEPINVRGEPSRNAEIVGKLYIGDTVEVIENSQLSEKIENIESYWYKIKFDTKEGYVFGSYIAV